MRSQFEFFVARRYLSARRKQAVVSVITAISVLGVAAGVMALVIALAINNGFRNTLQRNLLSATAHIAILEKRPEFGMENWSELANRLRTVPHVVAVEPALYGNVLFSGPLQSTGGILKGVDVRSAARTNEILTHLKQGSVADLEQGDDLPGIILGARLAEALGMRLRAVVRIMSPNGELTAFGPRPKQHRFRVVGIFESGFYELDANWAFVALPAAQTVLGVDNVVNSIELKLDDIYAAPQVASQISPIIGPRLAATTWMEQNRSILGALRMERAVTVVTIGLIQLVAALNILVALIMMVMEKHKDIAILMAMGARLRQIRRIFVLQGVMIGFAGSLIGLLLGYSLSYLAHHYRWIRLDAQVYSLSFVPFEARWADGIWIAAVAVFISFLATLYPSRSAARIAPAEALRYE